MHEQAGADTEVMEVLKNAVDDERAVLHHRLDKTPSAAVVRRTRHADFDRVGADREKLQRIRAELRALLGGQPGREVGPEPAKQASGENVEPARMLARGV